MFISEYIIYENENIIAVNKPEGMLVIPDGYDPQIPNLRDTLRGIYRDIFVVHRIDKLTSGIVLFAKNKEIHRLLNKLFLNRKIKKDYFAFIFGNPLWLEKTIFLPLRINGDRRHRTIIDFEQGKEARTDIKIIDRYEHFCSAQISPRTGYTHQIRAHLAALGNPIIGDELYCYLRSRDKNGNIYTPYCGKGMFLHAYSLEILDTSIDIPRLIAPIPEKYSVFNI